jgi:Uma2 family endonuclease
MGVAVRTGASTAEDLWNLPDDGLLHELVAGELRVMVPPGAEHGRVAATVAGLLFAHARETGAGVTFAGETGFLLARDPDTVRAPDAAFVTTERAEAVGRTEKYWPGAPDFAAEVISPSDTFAEVEAKTLGWLEAGTRLVFVLNPAQRTATAYRGQDAVHVHSGDDLLDPSDAVPGWQVALADFFR